MHLPPETCVDTMSPNDTISPNNTISHNDLSMRSHDNTAIPLAPPFLRNLFSSKPIIPTPTPAAFASLITSATPASLLRLRAILAASPPSSPVAATALKKTLSTDPAAALAAAAFLVQTVPFFYRYIAFQSFYKALRKTERVPPHSETVLCLLRDWGAALRVAFPDSSDPAASFWKDRVARMEAAGIVFPNVADPALVSDPTRAVCLAGRIASRRRLGRVDVRSAVRAVGGFVGSGSANTPPAAGTRDAVDILNRFDDTLRQAEGARRERGIDGQDTGRVTSSGGVVGIHTERGNVVHLVYDDDAWA